MSEKNTESNDTGNDQLSKVDEELKKLENFGSANTQTQKTEDASIPLSKVEELLNRQAEQFESRIATLVSQTRTQQAPQQEDKDRDILGILEESGIKAEGEDGELYKGIAKIVMKSQERLLSKQTQELEQKQQQDWLNDTVNTIGKYAKSNGLNPDVLKKYLAGHIGNSSVRPNQEEVVAILDEGFGQSKNRSQGVYLDQNSINAIRSGGPQAKEQFLNRIKSLVETTDTQNVGASQSSGGGTSTIANPATGGSQTLDPSSYGRHTQIGMGKQALQFNRGAIRNTLRERMNQLPKK